MEEIAKELSQLSEKGQRQMIARILLGFFVLITIFLVIGGPIVAIEIKFPGWGGLWLLITIFSPIYYMLGDIAIDEWNARRKRKND